MIGIFVSAIAGIACLVVGSCMNKKEADKGDFVIGLGLLGLAVWLMLILKWAHNNNEAKKDFYKLQNEIAYVEYKIQTKECINESSCLDTMVIEINKQIGEGQRASKSILDFMPTYNKYNTLTKIDYNRLDGVKHIGHLTAKEKIEENGTGKENTTDDKK